MKLDLGQSSSFRIERFTIYLPARDRFGGLVSDIDEWVEKACRLLADINGGVTRLSPAQGMWYHKATGNFIRETTHIVYSYTDPQIFLPKVHLVRDFIKAFGRETRQECVAVEFGDSMHFVSDFGQSGTEPAVSTPRAKRRRLNGASHATSPARETQPARFD